MRTLVQTDLINSGSDEDNKKTVLAKFKEMGFSPTEIVLSSKWKTALLRNLEPISENKTALDNEQNIDLVYAIKILFSIPIADYERQEAIHTLLCMIEFYDHKHTQHVRGLVCLSNGTIRTRWTHHVSRTLESTTEFYVKKIRENSGKGKTFLPFIADHIISVRESLSNNDTYTGKINLTDEQIRKKVLHEKRLEYSTARYGKWIFIVLTLISLILLSFKLYLNIQNEFFTWLIGFIDRLSTAAIVTTIVSYLSYRFHKSNLKEKPIIEWQ